MAIRNCTDSAVFRLHHESYGAPGAGALHWAISPPTRAHLTIAHFTAKFVADANAGDRVISIGRWIGGVHYVVASHASAITAGQTWYLIGSLNARTNNPVSFRYLYFPLPDLPFLHYPEYLSVWFHGVKAGDVFSEFEVDYKLWVFET